MTELGTTWLQEMQDHLVCPFSGTSWWAVLGTAPPLRAQLSLLQEASLDSDLSSLGCGSPFFQAWRRRFGCGEGGTNSGEGQVREMVGD